MLPAASAFPAGPSATPLDTAWHARYRRSLPALRLVLLLLACLSIWAGETLHYFVSAPAPSTTALAELRRSPADARLEELGDYALGIRIDTPSGVLDAARQLAAGSLAAPGFAPFVASPAAYPRDLVQGGSTQQLVVAGFGLEQLLLDAYAASRDPALLALATARMRSLARDEASRWRPRGLLWNDHAVAARVGVLAQWWRHYRQSPAYADEVAADMLGLAVRSGALLARADHFTVATNHGVMQNLALLQLAAAFPSLPQAADWKREALRRLALQLPYYVSDEGFVLEHSADYQFLGVELLARTARLLEILGEPVPPALATRLARAQGVLDLLLRPDGTLPLTGNTGLARTPGVPRQAAPGQPVRNAAPPAPAPQALLAPLSGYALWWSGQAESQVLTAWSRFPGHGHKHADEPSVHLWQGGTSWLTASGYWPYDVAGHAEANGWAGSNAPHLVDEPANAERALIVHAASMDDEALRVVDVERRSAAGLTVRRQVVQIDAHTLLVVDFAQGAPGRRLRTIWTVDPRARLRLETARQAQAARTDGVAGGLGLAYTDTPSLRHGSLAPFAGWVVQEREPRAADALVFEGDGGDSRTAYLFRLGAADAAAPAPPQLLAGARPDAWQMDLEWDGRALRLQRDGMSVRSTEASGAVRETRLRAVDAREADRHAMAEALRAASAEFPKWRDLAPYRLRLIALLLAAAVGFELFLLALAAWRGGALLPAPRRLNAIVLIGWGAVVAWALRVYLR